METGNPGRIAGPRGLAGKLLVAGLAALALGAGAGLWWWRSRESEEARSRRFLSEISQAPYHQRSETAMVHREARREYTGERTVTLAEGRLQARLSLKISTSDGDLNLRGAEPAGEASGGAASLVFDVPLPPEAARHSYEVSAKILSLVETANREAAWKVVEGRWLGEVASIENAGENAFQCVVPCRADRGGDCELHLVAAPAAGGSLQAGAVLRISFLP